MKNILIVLLLSVSYLQGQITEDFFLNYSVEKVEENDQNEYVATVRTLIRNGEVSDKEWVGNILPIYEKGVEKPDKLGRVNFVGMDEGNHMFQMVVPKNGMGEEVVKKGKGLIRYPIKITSNAEGSLVFEMARLGIGMYDVYGKKNLLKGIWAFDKTKISADEFYIPSLLEEIVFVAKAMREQMESPPVKEGRFKGKDLFTAMENSSYWDVLAFLVYIQLKPYKYQGTDWKVSEIYATWIDAGSPGSVELESKTIYEQVKNKMLNEWGFDAKRDFEMNFLRGVPEEILKEISSEFRSEVDGALEAGKTGQAHKYYLAAEKIARFMKDDEELAWAEYKHGQILAKDELLDLAIEAFIIAQEKFKGKKNNAGVLIVNNDLGNTYNTQQIKSSYKKAIKVLEDAIEISKNLPQNDKNIAPVIALLYRNLGDSYKGLKNYKKALGIYRKGISFTQVKSNMGLKRKAVLEMSISEVYGAMGDSSQQKEYENKSVATYLEYEKKMKSIKGL